MKRKSATMKSAADQRLTLPLSAACAPELIAVRIAAVLMPPRADMTISRSREPYISRRTSVKKDIAGCARLHASRVNPTSAEKLPLLVQRQSIALRAVTPFDAF